MRECSVCGAPLGMFDVCESCARMDYEDWDDDE